MLLGEETTINFMNNRLLGFAGLLFAAGFSRDQHSHAAAAAAAKAAAAEVDAGVTALLYFQRCRRV